MMSTASVLKARVHTEHPRTGIEPADAKRLAGGLARCLGATYVLYAKTQGFHWNVVGPLFHGLHKLTEAQYRDLAEATDALAERMRALGHPAPASLAEFLRLSPIEETAEPLAAEKMVDVLVADHETAARTLREWVGAADEAGDAVTSDLLTERIHRHEEAAWMLRSIATR